MVKTVTDHIKKLVEILKNHGDIPVTLECIQEDGSTATYSVCGEVTTISVKDHFNNGWKIIEVYDLSGDDHIDSWDLDLDEY